VNGRAFGFVGSGPDDAPDRADDWALWRRACNGHRPSAQQLVRGLTPQAYALAIQWLGRREDAEDAVQDAFLRLWRSVPSADRGARLSTYFNTIVINRCRSLRSAPREDATDPEVLVELHDARSPGAGPSSAARGPDSASAGGVLGEAIGGFGSGSVQARLRAALARLPVRQRLAITMWAYADAEVPAIAHALELNANAVHQLLHRARQALRAELAPTEADRAEGNVT
jgi:RNA polymerase sigma-70 factor (ECF subfamily)